MHAEVRPPKNYDAFASLYDLVAHVGSVGSIRASKACQTPRLRPGDRVLFAGSGTGEDAVAAARLGCHVTCVDASTGMLARARTRARRAGIEIDCVHGDIRSHEPAAPFDAVCANHLLNVFAEPEAKHVLARLAGFVRPGGIVMVADFAPPRGLRDAILHAHWCATVTIGALFRLCDLHRLYDYTTWLDDAGLVLVEQRRFAVLGVLPAYRNLVLQRPFAADAEN